MQDWIKANYPDFIDKDQWPLISPDLTPPPPLLTTMSGMGTVLEAYHTTKTENSRRTERNAAVNLVQRFSLPQEPIDKAAWERISKATEVTCCS